ncbi:glycosyltransferase [Streptomyces sp. 8N706]|uniref:glycosyltransferase n=1 Tax=Streptomyces sp. 8N706 TaxID=3457416 RepID=UPI003FD58045
MRAAAYEDSGALSVVVPCFNEEQVLKGLNDGFHGRLSERGGTYEMVCVFDGSTDGTQPLPRKFASIEDHVRCLSLSRNLGKEAGLLAGVRESTGTTSP